MNQSLNDEFINALQLCLSQPIKKYGVILPSSRMIIDFEEKPEEERWNYFQTLSQGEWISHKKFSLTLPQEDALARLTKFLLLTRLKKENIIQLSKMDTDMGYYGYQLFPSSSKKQGTEMETLSQANQIIFSHVEQQKMTLQTLAHRTGLSMVSISKFKSGKDIRLSNFVKIAKALGLKVKLEP